jgi:PKD domain
LTDLRSIAARRLTLALGLMATLSVSFLFALSVLPAPASAHVEEVPTKLGGPKIKVGLQPRESEYFWYGPGKYTGLGKSEGVANTESAKFENATGNAVVHTANTYAIYWDPQDYYHGDWQGLIDGFLANVGTAGSQLASVFAVDGQYTDKTNKPAAPYSSFRGAYTDTHPYPATNACTDPRSLKFGVPFLEGTTTPICVTAAQVQTELERFIKQREEEHDALPKGMGTIFYLLTPPGVTVCLNEGEVAPGGAHCSDFKGTPIEISRYEEGQKRFPEEEKIYATELEAYNKAIVKYNEELTEYNEAKTKYNEELTEYNEALVAYEDELKIYKQKRAEDEAKKERDTETEPVKPVKPVEPTVPVKPEHPFKPVYPKTPEGYKTYKQSFCSYHSVIGSGTGAIIYAAIPWTAGGDGDYHLTLSDETGGFACQDGGFEPNEKELEAKEREPKETAKARFEFEEQATGTREAAEEEKEQDLTKPVDQEPNQLGPPPVRGPDGSFDTGLADLVINQIAVEQQDIVTDPLLNAWQDPTGNEVTDECRNIFVPGTGGAAANEKTLAGTLSDNALGGGSYYLNAGYSLADIAKPHPGVEYPGLPYPAADPCPVGVRLEPKFTAPNTVKGGEVVGFNGMESDISLNSAIGFSAAGKPQPNYATYTWNFGDGSRGDKSPEVSGYAPGAKACEPPWLSEGPPTSFTVAGTWIGCAASVFHPYQYRGTYNVTLTVRDVGGNEATTAGSVTVVEGEVWPEEKGSGGSGSETGGGSGATPGASTAGTSGSSSSTAGSSGAGSTAKTFPGPVASAAAVTHSLSKALKSGLVISYSVNEQVAGQFQVLLASSVAKRIGLHGPPAIGLAPGSAPSIVIGKAILITTKGGRNTVKIQFGKKTAAKLRKLRRVSLTIRLVVRNASAQHPISTTVISIVNLSR